MGSGVFWAVCFGFLSGVFVRSLLPLGIFSAIFFFILALAALGTAFNSQHKNNHAVVAVALAFCALGILRMQYAALLGDPVLTAHLGQSVSLEGEIVEEPDARDRETLVTVRVSTLVIAASTAPIASRVLATLPAHARVSYGDHVTLHGKLQLPQTFLTGQGRVFDYPTYLAAEGIAYELGYARIESVAPGIGNPLQSFAIAAKEKFQEGLSRALPDPEAALAGGITVGDKRSIGPELTADFQKDSLVHMVVLSGYNITVVLNALARMLAWAPLSIRFAGNIAGVVFFIFLSGGASSAVRASLMALIASVARASRRTYAGERALAAVACGMVAWNPFILAFDPSFQLSSLATLGLVLFTPITSAALSFTPERFGIREILASTCATQAAVLPLLLYQSGTLSLVALPANIAALLPVPLAMLFAFVAGVAGMIFAPGAAWVSLPAYALLWYIAAVAHLFSIIPFAAVSVPAFGFSWVLAAYALLFGGYMFFTRVQKERGSPSASRASQSL